MSIPLNRSERRLLVALDRIRGGKRKIKDTTIYTKLDDEHLKEISGRFFRLGLLDGGGSLESCEISEVGRSVIEELKEKKRAKAWIVTGVIVGAVAAIFGGINLLITVLA